MARATARSTFLLRLQTGRRRLRRSLIDGRSAVQPDTQGAWNDLMCAGCHSPSGDAGCAGTCVPGRSLLWYALSARPEKSVSNASCDLDRPSCSQEARTGMCGLLVQEEVGARFDRACQPRASGRQAHATIDKKSVFCYIHKIPTMGCFTICVVGGSYMTTNRVRTH